MKKWFKLFEEVSEYHWQLNALPVWEKYEDGKEPWQSLAIFLSTYAYQWSGVNPNYDYVAEDTIKERTKEIKKNKPDLENKIWKLFAEKMTSYGDLNYGHNPLSPFPLKHVRKSDGKKSLISRMQDKKIVNLIPHAKECLERDAVLEAFTFLKSIRGVGPKISSFFLGDVSVKYDIKSTKDRELLQPIDIWIRRIVFKIHRKNWGAKNAYDKSHDTKITQWINDEADKAKCNPERINKGMWYFGSQVCGKSKYRFDVIFRDFKSAEKAWKIYCERMQRICSIRK